MADESHVQKGVPEEILGDVGWFIPRHPWLLRFGIWTPQKKHSENIKPQEV